MTEAKGKLRIHRDDRDYLRSQKTSKWRKFVQVLTDMCERHPPEIPHPLPKKVDESDRAFIDANPSDIERLQRIFPGLEIHQIAFVWVHMLRERQEAA